MSSLYITDIKAEKAQDFLWRITITFSSYFTYRYSNCVEDTILKLFSENYDIDSHGFEMRNGAMSYEQIKDPKDTALFYVKFLNGASEASFIFEKDQIIGKELEIFRDLRFY
jgi:hypothetical protein